MARIAYLDKTGLTTLWSKCKAAFAAKNEAILLKGQNWSSGAKSITGASAYNELRCVVQFGEFIADVTLHKGSDSIIRGTGIALREGLVESVTTKIVGVRLTISGDTVTGAFASNKTCDVKTALDDSYGTNADVPMPYIKELYGVR